MANRRRGNGEGTIYQDKNGTWIAKITIGRYPNGNLKFKMFSGKRRSEVLSAKREYEATHVIADKPSTEIYFDSYIMNWMESVKKNTLKRMSYDRALRTIEYQINPCIGHYRLCDLTTSVIQNNMVNYLRDTKNSVTGATNSFSVINKAYVYTHACLKYAVMVGDLQHNPCDGVELPRALKSAVKQSRFLNDEEILRLFDASLRNPCYFAWVFRFMVYTGLRSGEMLALKKDCIDLENKRIYVKRTIIKEEFKVDDKPSHAFVCQEDVKNSRPRYIPLSDNAVECIRPYYVMCPSESFYIMTRSEKFLSPTTLMSKYRTICREAGIENPQGLHTLRHTFGSKLIRNGVDIKTVSELLGHASVAFTYNTYIHLIEEQKTAAVNTINF